MCRTFDNRETRRTFAPKPKGRKKEETVKNCIKKNLVFFGIQNILLGQSSQSECSMNERNEK